MKFKNLLVEVINEVSIAQLKQQFVDSGKFSPKVFDEIESTVGGKSSLATWMVKKVVEKIILPEDVYKWKEYFQIFMKFKKEYPKSDIFQYKTSQDIKDFISKTLEIKDRIKQDPSQNKGVFKHDKYKEFIIGQQEGFIIYELPKGRKDLYGVSCDLGSNTEWCTATGKTRQYFDSYITSGPLFIVYNPTTKEKYQFSYETSSFMNSKDEPLF